MRISPSELCFSDYQAWRDIYIAKDGKENPKYQGLYGRATGHIAESILGAGQERHKVMRGIIADGFSKRAVRGHERLIMTHVDIMIHQLRSICQESVNKEKKSNDEDCKAEGINVDLNQWFYWYATDFVTDLVLGESLHSLESLETPLYLQFLTAAPQRVLIAVALSHLGLGTMVDLMAHIFASKFSQMSADLTQKLEKNHDRGDQKRGDLAELLIEANAAGVCLRTPSIKIFETNSVVQLLTREQLLGTANFLVIAGSETLALTLAAFIYFIASNSTYLARITNEILSAFEDEHEITLKRTEKLEFLNACLKETMRIFPAFAGGPPRVVAKGGRAIAGVFVPEDASPPHPLRKLNTSSQFIDYCFRSWICCFAFK